MAVMYPTMMDIPPDGWGSSNSSASDPYTPPFEFKPLVYWRLMMWNAIPLCLLGGLIVAVLI